MTRRTKRVASAALPLLLLGACSPCPSSCSAAAASDLYRLDAAWSPQFPRGAHTFSAVGVYSDRLFVTQRGNSSLDPVLVSDTNTGKWLGSWGATDVALALPGRTWGAHGLSVEACESECSPGDPLPHARIWIEDFTNHTVTSYSSMGKKYEQLGSPGVAGNGTDPVQFGNVADAYVVGGSATRPTLVYASDGDGGYANRVVKMRVSRRGGSAVEDTTVATEWATGHVFDNPHSITLHVRSGLLVVADREQRALKLLRSSDGNVLGTWNCGLKFGDGYGVPFGVRALAFHGRDLLFVASMDNPQDHKYQKISVIDTSQLSSEQGTASACAVLQTIRIDPQEYSGPHLLGVDSATGDVYAALVADVPKSTVLRFRLNK
jgi:hypothetical protein